MGITAVISHLSARPVRLAAVLAGLFLSLSPSVGADRVKGEAPYIAQNVAAMTTMMRSMQVKPTGDVDRDFVALMVPHHQGAIDMAIAVLRYGHNEQLKRLAQEIIVTQQQEIAVMRLAIAQTLPPSIPAPTEMQLTDVSNK